MAAQAVMGCNQNTIIMTPNYLREKYYLCKVSSHSKGAKGGKKVKVEVIFDESKRRRDFLNEFEEADAKACGLFLCKVEWHDMTEDRWWDVETCRADAVRAYRDRIKGLRLKYGLSKSEVEDFMRV